MERCRLEGKGMAGNRQSGGTTRSNGSLVGGSNQGDLFLLYVHSKRGPSIDVSIRRAILSCELKMPMVDTCLLELPLMNAMMPLTLIRALEDSRREREMEQQPVKAFTGPAKDYSIKEGEKIRVSIPKASLSIVFW